jgi:hypothetical protein
VAQPELQERVMSASASCILATPALEIWRVAMRNRVREPAMIQVETWAWTDDGQMAGFCIQCVTIAPGREVIDLPVYMPQTLGIWRAGGRTECRVRATWLGEFGAGLVTCKLLEPK